MTHLHECSPSVNDYQEIAPQIVRSNTHKVHSSGIPSAARQLNHRLCPHVDI